MRGLGTLVNVATVLTGSMVGLLVGARLPARVRETVLGAVGLVTVVIGVADALRTHNVVFPLVALVVGGALGEALRVEERMEGLGERVRRLVQRPHAGDGETDSGAHGRFVEGFVSASLLFCVGPLTIVGSLHDGLGRGASELIVKAALDGLVAVVFASTLGAGVALSALTVLVVQGALTLGAGALAPLLSERMVLEITATGGVIIIAIGLRLLEVKALRIGSYLPALLLAPVAVALFAR